MPENLYDLLVATDLLDKVTGVKESILNRQSTRLNYDLIPNSEYYVTYPFAKSISTHSRLDYINKEIPKIDHNILLQNLK
jgi:hypothetical protein